MSAECPLLRAEPGETETRTAWHAHNEDGHIYLVDFTPGSVHFQGCINDAATYFAAPELEPVDDADQSYLVSPAHDRE